MTPEEYRAWWADLNRRYEAANPPRLWELKCEAPARRSEKASR